MRKLLKVVFVCGVLFWGSFLAYGLVMMVGYNGFGNHYSFTCKNAEHFTIAEEENNNLKISYTYEASGKSYNSIERVSGDLFREKVSSISTLAICYNDSFPSLSYLQNVNLSVHREKTGVIISLFFLLLICVLYVFAKRDYWIHKYEALFKK
jgi:hypothetical protein